MPPTELGMPTIGLFQEAKRQLDVCNSCRYCAGYCPVWPALELRVDPTPADTRHLANLCHDCRDCFTACMYTPPHEFQINPPAMFAAVREETYSTFIRPRAPRRPRSRLLGAFLALAVSAIVVLALAALTQRGGSTAPAGSAYDVIGHGLLVAAALVPALFAAAVMLVGNARFWRETYGSFRLLASVRAWRSTLAQAATLRHQPASGHGCDYPDDTPSGGRRIYHQTLVLGFLLTLVSTLSAALLEYLGNQEPPYPYLSVPVARTPPTVLLVLKRRSDPAQSTSRMLGADYALLLGLAFINVTGLLVLTVRATDLFQAALVAHLAIVLSCFAVAPYTKFVHWTFRLLAIYADNLEQGTRAPG